jgi:hypothetical protein
MYIYIYKTKTETKTKTKTKAETKTKTREGGSGGNGGRTCIYTMEYHHTEAPYSFTIQDHHTIKMQTFRDYHAILCQAIHIISHDNLVW